MRHDQPTTPSSSDACCCALNESSAAALSRRTLLAAAGAGFVGGAAAAQMLPSAARAQGAAADADGLLARVQGARRILLKGGVVLTLDRQIGDFAQADVLIEDGKIREVRPNIAASGDAITVDAAGHIIIPGFVDTHSHSYQGLLRGILANGLL